MQYVRLLVHIAQLMASMVRVVKFLSPCWFSHPFGIVNLPALLPDIIMPTNFCGVSINAFDTDEALLRIILTN